MTYGSGCWVVKKKDENKLNSAEMRMLRWARGKTRLDHIRKEAHVKPVETFLEIGSFEKDQRSRYDMSQSGYVPSWTCPEVTMSRNGYVPKRLCPETAMSRNGYVPKPLCPEVAMSRNGYVPKRLSRSGYVPKRLCPETSGALSPTPLVRLSYNFGFGAMGSQTTCIPSFIKI